MKLTNEQLIIKWTPIMVSSDIDKIYYEKVSQFCENHLSADISDVSSQNFKSYLSHNLRIISKIKDLSKVVFMTTPVNFEYNNNFYSSGTYRVKALSEGIEPVLSEELIEAPLIEESIKYLNSIIDNGHKILLYRAYTNFLFHNDDNEQPYFTIDIRFTSIPIESKKENIKETYGNLITMAYDGNFDIIIHGCNCQNVMGSGIAREVRERIPSAYETDQLTIKGDIRKLGNYTSSTVPCNEDGNFLIINAYTQYGHNSQDKPFDYEAFTLILRKINHEYKGKTIGIPLIGAGLAGGYWDKIKPIIKKELMDLDVTIVHFDGSK